MWDPALYGRYADHRSRPFLELIARIDATDPALVYDLGCGPGELTAALATRWPHARIVGIDNDPAMLELAHSHTCERVRFQTGDLSSFLPPRDADVVVSNAAYHWVESNVEQLRRIAGRLPRGGWLAVQVPGNFEAPSHRILRAVLDEPVWQRRTGGVRVPESPVLDAAGYGDLFSTEGLQVDTWETTYNQVLAGPDAVLQWVRGTTLRPALGRLDESHRHELIETLRPILREAYPAGPAGTPFPFRRIFAVGHRPARSG
ncbi:methyltransferase domain-containing protein [Blastococcus sp. Marseille-P5729]|uniref:methyltransferase domain-containing protein n=1 Tax=Blastococcus sp. Marseille-P5729 TaxID=2086582 RepID=UPI000D0FB977|nr:methyltransferase domain-containing protein [Blastococcus sp. Marseille-P5729]